MARKLSTRKRPERDVHMVREQLKIEEGVFDKRTMMCLWRMFNHRIITRLDFVLRTGKEADVYIADAGENAQGSDFVVLKIFRIETSSFPNRMDYIVGDPRFEKIKNNVQEVVNTWCKKEYGNLKAAEMAGVRAPRPYYFRGNVLAMEFIGYDGKPANTLKETELAEPQEVLDMILSDLRKLYKAEFVHGDVSEYNILMNLGTPYLIDFGQAVVLNHPRAMEFLKRDVHNITAYFARKYGIMNDEETIVGQITGR